MKETINYIISYIKENLLAIKNIETLAKHFGYSKFYFSREFKKITGFSLQSFISSLKLEYSIELLVKRNNNVISSQLNAGFLSSSSFTATFENQTGVTPKKYQQSLCELYDFLLAYENMDKQKTTYYDSFSTKNKSKLIVTLEYPSDFKSGITFVGLFNTPIPNHKPIIGQAITSIKTVLFENIPNGIFYILVCAIKPKSNLIDYFVLKNSLRGMFDKPLTFPSTSLQHINIVLRKPLPEDPPININLPMLLANVFLNPSSK